MNARQIWIETSEQLEKVYNRREAENMSYLLLEDLFEISREEVMLASKVDFDLKKLEKAVSRLLDSEPLQYVTGVSDFYGRKFLVTGDVLIPRPETEELVDMIIQQNSVVNPKILDIGTGSGCIAITLAMELSGQVYGSDVSMDAIAMAQRNASKLSTKVSFICNDVIKEAIPVNDLDVLVSNPPYIPEVDKTSMHANVLGYEPALALFVPDEDPLIFYQRIASEGRSALKRGGRIYFEIHERYGSEVKEILNSAGYKEVGIYRDMQDKDRIVSAIN